MTGRISCSFPTSRIIVLQPKHEPGPTATYNIESRSPSLCVMQAGRNHNDTPLTEPHELASERLLMSSASSSSSEDSDAEASSDDGQTAAVADGKDDSQQEERSEKEKAGEEDGVWGHLDSVIPSHERQRLEREAVLRKQEEEKERAAEAAVYVGKPDMRPSWDGGGWGGPKDGYDMDTRYMLRGEARELPDHIYQNWKFQKNDEHLRIQVMTKDKKKKAKKKKGKGTDVPRKKKDKKDKKKKKSKKEKAKKDKKAGKKKKRKDTES